MRLDGRDLPTARPPPGSLAELRAVLLQEHVGRLRDGLS